MRGAHPHPHRQVADGKLPVAVHAAGTQNVEALVRLADHPFTLAEGELGIHLVVESGDRQAVVVVPHPSLEGREAAGARVGQVAPLGRRVDRQLGQRETVLHHPPATGGMNTTRSPSRSGWLHGTKSPLQATRSRSADRLKEKRARSSA